MSHSEALLGLPNYQINPIERKEGEVRVSVQYLGPICCPNCGGEHLRDKGRFQRRVRHENWGMRKTVLELEGHKWRCLDCRRYFRQRFPGILACQRSSEAFRQMIYQHHLDGINRSCLGRREGIGAATVERHFRHGLQRQFGEWHAPQCPTILGIDEHFFTRKKGFATTLCDLKNHKIYDVVLGRSEAALDAYFQRLQGKDKVRVVCIDLASHYRSLVQKHFPNAKIVADRFHVIRLVNHHFLACWRELDPTGCKNLLKKHKTRKQCERLVPRFLKALDQLHQAGVAQLVQLGKSLWNWREEIVRMWRFTKNNGITEGFHNKMETISRQAFGFRNFQNYRLRVKVLCGV